MMDYDDDDDDDDDNNDDDNDDDDNEEDDNRLMRPSANLLIVDVRKVFKKNTRGDMTKWLERYPLRSGTKGSVGLTIP